MHHNHHSRHYNSHEEEGVSGMQEVIQMCSTFDAAKSTKGASKLRRDLINSEIANLRDLLPLPSSTRQRLSQLQLMALVCVYVRKANYFQNVFKRNHELGHPFSTPNIGFSKSLSGFLIMMTQNGKLLYISDNAAEYLGHSMEDLLIHGDSVYDIIDKADHGTVQSELLRNSGSSNSGPTQGPTANGGMPSEETRLFLCRMNVSRNARRQMRFGDQKVVLLQGRYLSYLPLCSRNEPVFVGSCTPVAMPETRECVVQGATNVFTTIHAMDMKFMHVDKNGEHYLGYTRQELGGVSWYNLIHWNYMREAQSKHRLISQSEQEKSCILLLRMETRSGDYIWIHCVLQVKDGSESNSSQPHPTQSIIVATNQVLSDREASVMRANSWLYHYYTVQTKLQYGLAYPEAPSTTPQLQLQPSAAAARLAAAAYFPAYPDPYAHSHAHNGNGYHHHATHPHPYAHPHHFPHPHHAHQFEGVIKGKESPLDFSLASVQSSAFDPYYWHHHHHQSHGGGVTNNGSTTSSNSSLSSGGHHYHSHNHQSQSSYYSAGIKPESGSGASPGGAWSLSISSSKGQHISTSNSQVSPSSQSRKKHKKSSGGAVSGGNGTLSSSSQSPPPPQVSSQRDLGSGGVVAAATFTPHHPRSRTAYKLLGDEGVREENLQMMMACPLTPSPIWEGQTQRVPDLGGGTGISHTSGVPDFSPGSGSSNGSTGSELIHCVPTYLPYTSGVNHSAMTSSPHFGYLQTPYSYGFPLPPHPHYFNGGSPNKENRLPPTPESDTGGENEENKPIKWESL